VFRIWWVRIQSRQLPGFPAAFHAVDIALRFRPPLGGRLRAPVAARALRALVRGVRAAGAVLGRRRGAVTSPTRRRRGRAGVVGPPVAGLVCWPICPKPPGPAAASRVTTMRESCGALLFTRACIAGLRVRPRTNCFFACPSDFAALMILSLAPCVALLSAPLSSFPPTLSSEPSMPISPSPFVP